MSGILNAFSGGTYSGLPGAPTIGTATATGATTATVAFTAPTNTGGLPITGYQAISSPGSITATGASSPITVTGLTASTSYTFQVRAQNSLGYGSYSGSSNSITTLVAPGSQSYTASGTYTWVAPANVTSVSVVAVGGGGYGAQSGGGCRAGGGGGGGLGWRNNIAVTPGSSYCVVVGGRGGCSYFINTSTVAGYRGICGSTSFGSQAAGGSYSGQGGGAGGKGGKANSYKTGGGGAGGYSGTGGGGGGYYCCTYHNGCSGSGGGAGGGGGGSTCPLNGIWQGGAGGGVGIFGQGANGSGGPAYGQGAGGGSGASSGAGGGGSGGANGYNYTYYCFPAIGGNYGGGAGGYAIQSVYPAGGAVRIVWPGATRQFPSTCVGSP